MPLEWGLLFDRFGWGAAETSQCFDRVGLIRAGPLAGAAWAGSQPATPGGATCTNTALSLAGASGSPSPKQIMCGLPPTARPGKGKYEKEM